MIVVDSSALIAILDHEEERFRFYDVIAASPRRLVSAVTYQEAGQVMFARRGVNGLCDLQDLLSLIDAGSCRTTPISPPSRWTRFSDTARASIREPG